MTTIDEFIITKEYKRFAEFCKVCRESRYIGLCYGPAGVGKSMSISHYANWDNVLKEIKPTLCPRDKISSDTKASHLDTVVYTPEITNSPSAIRNDIWNLVFRTNDLNAYIKEGVPISFLSQGSVKMVIIDEADRLQPKSLEQVRDIYDQSHLAIILVGMPGIEKRLLRFPQLYSRIGFAHTYKTLSQEEVSFILQNHYKTLNMENPHDFSNEEAIAAIIRITNGNFRLLHRLLKQATRVMEVNKLTFMSKEVIEAARECLVIGNI